MNNDQFHIIFNLLASIALATIADNSMWGAFNLGIAAVLGIIYLVQRGK